LEEPITKACCELPKLEFEIEESLEQKLQKLVAVVKESKVEDEKARFEMQM